GARLPGRVATSPLAPPDPLGRPWQEAQLSLRPAPMPLSAAMSPLPSFSLGPCPCTLVNFRWKSWRPRRIDRKGSRAMMYVDDPTMLALPRPAPISSDSDLLMPPNSGFVACVLSIIWARAFAPSAHDE